MTIHRKGKTTGAQTRGGEGTDHKGAQGGVQGFGTVLHRDCREGQGYDHLAEVCQNLENFTPAMVNFIISDHISLSYLGKN